MTDKTLPSGNGYTPSSSYQYPLNAPYQKSIAYYESYSSLLKGEPPSRIEVVAKSENGEAV